MRRLLLAAGLAVLLLPPRVSRAAEDDLRQLAGTLHDELAGSDMDEATRAEVRALLLRSLQIVRNAPGRRAPDGPCVEFVLPIYEKVWQPTTALQEAGKFCSGDPVDGDVLRIAYGVFAKSFQPTTALAEAGKYARRRDLAGKAGLLSFALVRYEKQWQPSTALAEAAKIASAAPRGSEGCIERAMQTYSKQFQTDTALKESLKTCSGER